MPTSLFSHACLSQLIILHSQCFHSCAQKQGNFPSSGARVSADSQGLGPVFMMAPAPHAESPPKRPHLFKGVRSDQGLSLGAQLSPEATKRSSNGRGRGEGAGQSPGDGRTVTDRPRPPSGLASLGAARCGETRMLTDGDDDSEALCSAPWPVTARPHPLGGEDLLKHTLQST